MVLHYYETLHLNVREEHVIRVLELRCTRQWRSKSWSSGFWRRVMMW